MNNGPRFWSARLATCHLAGARSKEARLNRARSIRNLSVMLGRGNCGKGIREVPNSSAARWRNELWTVVLLNIALTVLQTSFPLFLFKYCLQ